jgi:hypothetical protein
MARYAQAAGFAGNVFARQGDGFGDLLRVETHPHPNPPLEGEGFVTPTPLEGEGIERECKAEKRGAFRRMCRSLVVETSGGLRCAYPPYGITVAQAAFRKCGLRYKSN